MGGGQAVLGDEALDAGFVCEEAMRALLTIFLGASDDGVVSGAPARVRRRSGQEEDVAGFSAAGEHRVDQIGGFRAQFGKRRTEPLVRVGSTVFDLSRISHRGFLKSDIGRTNPDVWSRDVALWAKFRAEKNKNAKAA